MSSPSTTIEVRTKPSFSITRSEGALLGKIPAMKCVTPKSCRAEIEEPLSGLGREALSAELR